MNSGQRERIERPLAAILAADVAVFTADGADEEGTHAALTALRRNVMDPKIHEHRGRIVKTTGDGLLVEFASVVDAVRWAVEVQREMALRGAAVPAERRIEFRIGINHGDIIIEEDDIYGDGVHCWLEHTRSRLKLKRRSLCWARPYRSELNRHKGQLLLRQGYSVAAEELYRKALDIPREQEAKL
jgi:hypothetical protein